MSFKTKSLKPQIRGRSTKQSEKHRRINPGDYTLRAATVVGITESRKDHTKTQRIQPD